MRKIYIKKDKLSLIELFITEKAIIIYGIFIDEESIILGIEEIFNFLFTKLKS